MAYTAQDIKRLCKGRTEEQKQAIKYFLGGGGCLSSTWSDEQYEAAVMAKAKSMDFKQKALNKISISLTQKPLMLLLRILRKQSKRTKWTILPCGKGSKTT